MKCQRKSYKQIKENLLSDRILSEFDRSYLTDLQNFLGLTDIEAEADLLDEILKTTYSLERFHDDVIGAITIDWLDGKIYISIIGWKKRWEVELLNFRNVSIPRQLPWGSSKYINSSKNQKNTNNLWELEIELQSGDVFKFEAEQVRLNQRKEELSDLEWLVGDRIASVQFESESNPWVINFASGATLQIESMWRLVELGALCSTSLDHGHRFGLAKDFDSVAALRGMGQYPIKSVTVRPMTGDLFLQLGSMFVLEVLSTSAGYEHWQITHPVLGLLVASGGELHVFPK